MTTRENRLKKIGLPREQSLLDLSKNFAKLKVNNLTLQ